MRTKDSGTYHVLVNLWLTLYKLVFCWFFFWFSVCYAATQLATPLHQRRIQVVRSNKVAIPYLARYSEIFKKRNSQVVEWKSTFIRKILSQAELETEGSGLATILGLPPTPPQGVYFPPNTGGGV